MSKWSYLGHFWDSLTIICKLTVFFKFGHWNACLIKKFGHFGKSLKWARNCKKNEKNRPSSHIRSHKMKKTQTIKKRRLYIFFCIYIPWGTFISKIVSIGQFSRERINFSPKSGVMEIFLLIEKTADFPGKMHPIFEIFQFFLRNS